MHGCHNSGAVLHSRQHHQQQPQHQIHADTGPQLPVQQHIEYHSGTVDGQETAVQFMQPGVEHINNIQYIS